MANGTSGSQRIVLQVDILIVPAHTCVVIAPWLSYYDMGWTTEDPMFDPRHRQVSRPDLCLLGCEDVSLGVSWGFDGTIFYLEYLISEDEGIMSLRNVGTRPKKRHIPEDTNSRKTTVGTSNAPSSRLALGATQPANLVGPMYE